MDRSFLSQLAVITASRNFVCIRLTCYEDETEMRFCRSLFVGRSGDAENTTFAILSPDGHEQLVRTHRGAKQIFADAAAMAAGLNQIASRYPSTPENAGHPLLPVTLDARLGLDVAASDGLPLVVVIGDSATQPVLEYKLGALAWNSELIGRFTYAKANSAKDIAQVDGITIKTGILLIEPDTFGQKGRVVKQLDANESVEHIGDAMRALLHDHRKTAKTSGQHRMEGIKQGAYWEPKLPVTDLQEAAARERTKRAIENQKKGG
jgi:hypothetical protein